AQPAEGAASSNGDGTFTFSPGAAFQDLAEGQTRQVSFTFKATDRHGIDSPERAVVVTVTGRDDAPAAQAASLSGQEDGSAVTTAVLAGDIDSDDSPGTLLYTILAQPAEGSAGSNGDG